MIKQSKINNDILEKKYKILKTSIMLGNISNRDDTISEFEKTARELDKYKRDVYEELLASKMYTTITLEEEQTRLNELINFVENRVNERNDFIDEYMKTTSSFLDDLPKVSLENELDEYRIRLDNINRYINNCKKIKEINDNLISLRDDLQEKYENKANNEIINSKLEDELIDEFNKITLNDEYYSSLNYTDIDEELIKINKTLGEKKDVMDTFSSSYDALASAGISGAEREEYLSYVQESKRDYYTDLEKRYILDIYKLVLDRENDYEKLYDKRHNLDLLLEERLKDRKKLGIVTKDTLSDFSSICKEQFSVIKSQRVNIDSIDKLILEITDCENQLDELDKDNNSTEIKELMDEYNVEKIETIKLDMPKEEKIHEKIIKENMDNNEKPDNMVIRIEEPIKMNLRNSIDTAKLVMKKVVIVLEPKKFNVKRDKLKEAEIELEERKRKERILRQEKKLEEERRQEELKKQEEEKREQIIDSIFSNDNDVSFKSDNIDSSSDLYKEIDDIFNSSISNNDVKSIKLETDDIFDDKKIVVDTNGNGELVIPTEVIIEEPPKEKELDLFKETDPFLDDNEFEIDYNNKFNDGKSNNMPVIKKIGSVKPNSMLDKIGDVQKENDNIILPTNGLINEEKESVPIVSENYIN